MNLLSTKITFVTAFTVCLATGIAHTEIIPASRRIEWTPGIPGGIADISSPAVNVRDHGATADGATDDHPAFAAAITALPSSGGVVLIPAGNYLLRNTITIGKPVVLRGEGADKTVLRFDHSGAARSCVQVVTYGRGTWIPLLSGYEKGSTRIVVANTAGFTAGRIVEVQQENDSAAMYTDPKWIQTWGAGAAGQLNVCAAVHGDTIVLERPLYQNYQNRLNPQIRTNTLVTGAGIEYLRIVKADASDGSTIEWKNVDRCWVRGVLSDTTRKSHITMNTAFRCEIRESCFRHSYDYGGGGHGYGVEMGLHTTDCLVENNVFVHLRHSMMVHVGASGNVFGYNYSREPNSGESWTPCDISLHGHWPNFNLFEGNVVQEIDFADYWGPSGPGNTVFRCKVESEGIDVLDRSHYQNIVGNILGNGADTIFIAAGVTNTLLHGNTVKGTVHWDASIPDQDIPASLYRTAKPSWFGSVSWPLFGPDAAQTNKPPAQLRYESGNCLGIAASEHNRLRRNCVQPAKYRKTGRRYDLRGVSKPDLAGRNCVEIVIETDGARSIKRLRF